MKKKKIFARDADGEASLLNHGSIFRKRDYILWHGIKSEAGQKLLAESANSYLIWLQTYIYGDIWDAKVRKILCEKGFLKKERPNDIKIYRKALTGWLNASLYGDRENEKSYGCSQSFWMNYEGKMPKSATEKEQLSWFDDKKYGTIISYPYVFVGKAFDRFILEAPEEALYRFLHYNLLEDDKQVLLVQREMKNHANGLLWFYFHMNRACAEAQELIQAYDNKLWKEMILLNYGWDNKFERKFGCLKAWREKLEDSWPLLSECPIAEIPGKLEKIV